MAPGAAPATISAPNIQARVQVDSTQDGGTGRLFTTALTAPGSASRFAPLPAALFGNGTAPASVCTTFHSLTFDPYTGNANSTGVTRLAFTDAASGAEVPVSNLGVPIYFTLPAVTLAGGKTACRFWDADAQAYATHGCVGIPDPRPASHTLAWADGFTATVDADMVAAWNGTGPLFAGCTARVLDCGAAEDQGTVTPNPANPFAVPPVGCNTSLSTAPLLVFVGSGCALIRADNAYGCTWDNIKQSFVGGGCVASGAPAQCACRHVRAARAALSLPALASLTRRSPCAAHGLHQRKHTSCRHVQPLTTDRADAKRHHRRPAAAAHRGGHALRRDDPRSCTGLGARRS
jgi:hypothetical protein